MLSPCLLSFSFIKTATQSMIMLEKSGADVVTDSEMGIDEAHVQSLTLSALRASLVSIPIVRKKATSFASKFQADI